MNSAVETYFAALNAGDWDALAARWPDGAALARLREAVSSWEDYEERPLQTVGTDGVVAVRTHFAGTTSAGVRIEFEPLTVLVVDGERIRSVSSWHATDATPEHLEMPTIAVVSEYFRAANAEDWESFEQVWADDAELQAVGGPPRQGRDEVVRAYRLFLGLFDRHEDHIERILVNGRAATVTGRFRGANPHGIAIEFAWVDVIELDADERRIAHLSHWHDRDLVRRLMEATESPEDRAAPRA